VSAAGLTIRVAATAEELVGVRAEVAACARAFGMSSDGVDDARTVVSEACANAIRHAYRDGPGGPLEVAVSASDGQLLIVVRDFGTGFGPRPEWDGIGLGAGLSIIGALTTDFRLESRRGYGTEIEARLPLPPRPPAVPSS
jgi:anti-sigma regulatory factor (Ser/Thr protein kinase)